MLEYHNLPLFQGRVVVALEKVFLNRTVFSHNEDPDCGEWHPLDTGLSPWGALSSEDENYTPDNDVTEINITLEGLRERGS